ncbi:MAG: spermidine/putrescine transport system ATP-binding protein [Chloroflexota bacterium]|nr:spermidine/putrescine transport system ATP-binding protein [Chloroflexota bacterium]
MTASLTSDAPPASDIVGSVNPVAAGLAAPDVEIIGVTKRFGAVTAVDAMDLSIARGTFYSLLGPSGCGKTTTLRMIAGYEQPTEGEILLAGQPIAGVPPYQRNVNTVFQHYALFPHMDVAQNVGYGLRQRKVDKANEERRVNEALALVRLEGYGKRRTWEMSGGQQQRVALARALVNRPTVLLLDEPLGALDLKLRKEMQLELKALQREVGITFVYVTHDQEEALTMSDVIVVMRDGRIQQQGDPPELYERPVNRFVAAFIGTSNFLPGSVQSIDSSTGRVAVRTDLGLDLRGFLTDSAAVGRVGDAVTVAVRPERIQVTADGAGPPDPGWSAIQGRIHQGTYLGDQTEFRVQTELAGELVVRRQNATGAQASQGLGPGDPVTVQWQEEANLVLAD